MGLLSARAEDQAVWTTPTTTNTPATTRWTRKRLEQCLEIPNQISPRRAIAECRRIAKLKVDSRLWEFEYRDGMGGACVTNGQTWDVWAYVPYVGQNGASGICMANMGRVAYGRKGVKRSP